MQVNPETLKSFATNLSTEAGAIQKFNEGAGFGVASNALPGTEFGGTVQQTTDVVNRCLQRIGERLTTVAGDMHNAAGAYELTEDDFAAKLRTIGLQVS
ncbi:type VII secretion target [Nocardia sp. NBC_01009]|uniref:type VII secretion target n=1 Tax=Nocardia sp. NBC_01009 TaxID=2975996 RepID=UPI003870E6DD|nr:type VII secretion target [Nocardia sp. NBC_01009]